VANVSLGINHRVHQGDAWVDGEPAFYDITLWKKAGENAAESFRQGDRVLFTAQVHTEAWTDSDGAKRTKQVVTEAEIGASTQFTNVEVVRTKRVAPAS
jgi:single-stranded DNA-binding protein